MALGSGGFLSIPLRPAVRRHDLAFSHPGSFLLFARVRSAVVEDFNCDDVLESPASNPYHQPIVDPF